MRPNESRVSAMMVGTECRPRFLVKLTQASCTFIVSARLLEYIRIFISVNAATHVRTWRNYFDFEKQVFILHIVANAYATWPTDLSRVCVCVSAFLEFCDLRIDESCDHSVFK